MPLPLEQSSEEFETSEDVDVVPNFREMKLKDELQRAISEAGFESPLALQQRSIKSIIEGRNIIVQADTNTGKTTALVIAMLQLVDTNQQETQVLCLSHRRDKAMQLQDVILALGSAIKVQCHVCVGGTNVREEKSTLTNQHIVSGTPGRVLDMINRKVLQTTSVRVLMLDEANELLKENFKDQIDNIYRCLPPATQVILMSSEKPSEIVANITREFISNPIRIMQKRKNQHPFNAEKKDKPSKNQMRANAKTTSRMKNKAASHLEPTSFDLNYNIDYYLDEFETSEDVDVVSNFREMSLKEELQRAISETGFESPLALQQRSIKSIIEGRNIIVQADTNTGKTTALVIAMLQLVDTNQQETQVLCLSHRRDKAMQLQDVILALGSAIKVQCHVCVGGTNVREEKSTLTNQHIVSGTPGRVLDMINRKVLQTTSVRVLMLDEANELLKENFKDQIDNIYRCLPPATQVILMSSEKPSEIVANITREFISNPIRIMQKRGDKSTAENDNESFKKFMEIDAQRMKSKQIELSNSRLLAIYDVNYDQITPAKSIKYFKEPIQSDYPLNLNDAYSTFKFLTYRTLRLLHPLLMTATAEAEIEGEGKTFVYARRGLIKQIMETVYQRQYNLNILVSRYDGKIFMIQKVTPKDMQGRKPVHTHHKRFFQLLFADSPHELPNSNEPLDENISQVGVYRNTLGKYVITHAGDIQGILADEAISNIDDENVLNKMRFIFTKQMWSFARSDQLKFLNYYLEAYLANVDVICMAHKDKNAMIREPIELVQTADIPKNRFWKPRICTAFLNEFLEQVELLMSDVNSLDIVYEFNFDSKRRIVSYRVHDDNSETSFIPKDFFEHTEKIPDL